MAKLIIDVDEALRFYNMDRENKLTRKEFLDKIGVDISDRTINYWKVGKIPAALDNLFKIAEGADCPLTFFIHKKNE